MTVRRCCTCKQVKDISEFHKNKPSCKECRKEERKRSYEKRKSQDYGSILEYNRTWCKENPERNMLHKKRWNQANAAKCRLLCNKRYSYAKDARVDWADSLLIEEIYHLAQLRTETTGIKWEVDHIIPIRGKGVCGLHVETNLQVIPRGVNASKQNRFTKQYKWSEFFQGN